MSMTREIAIAEVITDERARKQLGSLDALAASIETVGLLHPIVVASDLRLIAGQRRLAACQQLGWERVRVTIAADLQSAAELLVAERDENTCRLDLTPGEKVVLGLRLEELERPRAEQRQQDGRHKGGDAKKLGANFAPSFERARTADVVGAAVGLSRTTYKRAKRIYTEAQAGNKAAVAALATMNETGKVTGAYEAAFGETKTRSHKPRGNNLARLSKALKPLQHYIRHSTEYSLRGISPKEARSLLKVVREIESGLYDLDRNLDARTVVPRSLR